MMTLELNHTTKNTIKKIKSNINSGIIYFNSKNYVEFILLSRDNYTIPDNAISVVFNQIGQELCFRQNINPKSEYYNRSNPYSNLIYIDGNNIYGHLSSSQIEKLNKKGYFIIAIKRYDNYFMDKGLFHVCIK